MRIAPLLFVLAVLTPDVATSQPVVGYAPGTPLPDTSSGDLANMDSQTKALSVAPTISGVTSVSSASASTVIAAGTRSFWRIANNNAAGGSDLGCTDDGSTPTATHWDMKIYSNSWYETMRPGFVSNQAIQCIGITSSVSIVGESY